MLRKKSEPLETGANRVRNSTRHLLRTLAPLVRGAEQRSAIPAKRFPFTTLSFLSLTSVGITCNTMQRIFYALALWLPIICSAQLTGQYSFPFTNTFPLWDVSGTYARSEGGLEVENMLAHAPNGALTGTGSAHFSGNGRDITGTEQTKGRVNGVNTGRIAIVAAGKGEFTGSALGANISGPFSGTLNLTLNAETRIVSGTQSATLCVRGYGCPTITTNVSFALPENMTGSWTLTLDIGTTNNVVRGTATVQLSNGRMVSFNARGRYRANTGLTVLTLRGKGPALGVNLPLTLDSAGSITKLRGKLFGEKLVYPLVN
jgi:hypothetical protein